MASGGVVVQFGGDSSKLKKAIDEVDAAARKLDLTEKQLAQSAKEMERAAVKAFKESLTPAQQFQRQMEGIGKAFREDKISQDEYTAGVRKLKEEYRSATGEVKAVMVQTQQLAPVTKRSFVQSIEAVKTSSLAMVGAVSSAVMKVRDIFAEFDRVRSEAMQTIAGAGGEYAQLGQLPDEKRLRSLAKAEFAKGYGLTIDDPSKLVFQLKSAGMLNELQLFSALGRTGLIADAGEAAKQVAGLQKNLGIGATGDATNVLSMALGASAVSREGMGEILDAASSIGTSAKAAGMTPIELVGSIAALSTGMPSKEGATRMESLLFVMEKKGIKGNTFAEKLDTLQGELSGLSNENAEALFEYFGRKEGLAAFRFLQADRGLLQTAEAQAAAGALGSTVLQDINDQVRDPIIASRMRQAESRNMLQLQRLELGMSGISHEARMNDLEYGMRELGMPEIGISAVRTGFGMLPTPIQEGIMNRGQRNAEVVGALGTMVEDMRGIRENTQKTSRPRIPLPEN